VKERQKSNPHRTSCENISNTYIIGILEETDNGAEEVLEEIMAESFYQTTDPRGPENTKKAKY
jgi:hypothetical protein